MARKMKDSGIEWIGEIPEDWEIRRTKTLYTSYKDIVGDKANYYERLALTLKGVIRRDKEDNTGLQPKGFNGYQVLRKGELVFKLIDLENISTSRVGLSPFTGIVSPAYIILTPKNEILAKFGLYFFFSLWQRAIFNRMGDDGVRSSLNLGDLMNTPHCCTDLSEQQRIADFLDTKCAQIEEILQKTRDTIAEYKKLKQSVITQAVTKGVRGERPMKDSGIEWIGEIPEEWEIRKGKTILTILERPVRPDDRVITCFRDGEVTLRSNRREDGFTFSMQEAGYQGVEQGDLVVHGMDGFAGAIGISDSRGKATPVLNVLNTNQNKRYIMYYLRNMAFVGVFQSLSTGIRIRSCDTNWNKLKILSYLIPLQNEQQEIVAYLDQKCAEIDKLIEKKEQLVSELESYKKSLIYEYVTGKKEVVI